MKKSIFIFFCFSLILFSACQNNSGESINADSMIDSDFDGLPDYIDKNNNNNSYNATACISQIDSMYDFNFSVDYRWITSAENSVYNQNLCKLSALLSIDMAGGLNYIDVKSNQFSTSDKHTDFTNLLGLKDVKTYDLRDQNYNECQNDVTVFKISHHELKVNDEIHSVIFIQIKCSDGNDEWISNFDIGCENDFYFNMQNDCKLLWKNKNNHKGFDVTANRVLLLVNEYINEYVKFNSSVKKEFLITGHSRGAAIANILSTLMKEEKVFTYTFACPNTTTQENSETYDYIFNILNTDDIIGQIPLDSWGFTRYGKTKSFYAYEDIKDKWDEKIYKIEDGEKKSISFVQGYADIIKNSFEALGTNRNELYTIDRENLIINLPKKDLKEGLLKAVELKNQSEYEQASDETELTCYAAPCYITVIFPSLMEKITDALSFSNYTYLVDFYNSEEIKNSTISAPLIQMGLGYTTNGIPYNHAMTTYLLASEKIN